MKKYLSGLIISLSFSTFAQAAELKLTWADTSTNEVDFRIERSLSADTVGFAQVAIIPKDVITWTDTGLAEGITYFYRMRACNTGGCSPYTAIASGRTVVHVPSTPGPITVTPLP